MCRWPDLRVSIDHTTLATPKFVRALKQVRQAWAVGSSKSPVGYFRVDKIVG